MRNLTWKPIILVLALLLGACAGVLGDVPVLETPRERLVALEITFHNANLSIQDLVAAGTLHGEAATQVAESLKAALVAMRAVRIGVDGANGTELLDTANEALIALTARLKEESS